MGIAGIAALAAGDSVTGTFGVWVTVIPLGIVALDGTRVATLEPGGVCACAHPTRLNVKITRKIAFLTIIIFGFPD